MRVAFVHDWLTTYAGAEKVLEAAVELFPNAPIFTVVYDKENFKGTPIADREIVTSFLDRIPFGRKKYRQFLGLMPAAIEQLDVGDFDLVISTSHAVAKGVQTHANQLHISYVHTPIRYAWDLQNQYLRESKLDRGLRTIVARAILHYIRLWDVASANRVDVYLANSQYIANRIWKIYRRRARVVYPPVDVKRFAPALRRDQYYLTVSRLVPYKRMDLIVEAFNQIGRPLVVIGDGPDRKKLERIAGSSIQLLGYQPDHVVNEYLQGCKAFVYAAEEDFGIAPVEAQACGAPVIAYGRGGATETVLSQQTGILFHEQTAQSLVEAVQSFEAHGSWFDPANSRLNAERFSKERFQLELTEIVEQAWADFLRSGGRRSGGTDIFEQAPSVTGELHFE